MPKARLTVGRLRKVLGDTNQPFVWEDSELLYYLERGREYQDIQPSRAGLGFWTAVQHALTAAVFNGVSVPLPEILGEAKRNADKRIIWCER